jgi:hypothetical protein
MRPSLREHRGLLGGNEKQVPPLRRRMRSGSGRNDKGFLCDGRTGSGRNDKGFYAPVAPAPVGMTRDFMRRSP